MTGEKKIIEYVNRYISLSESEEIQFSSSFKETKIRKKQFIVQPDFTAKTRNYVLQGAFRSYIISEDGQDHTISFAINDWWITDYNSYIYQKPATMFVVALEDSVILQLDFEKEQELKRLNHKFETFFRIIAEKGLAFYQRRMISNLTQSAEERYDDFMNQYSVLAQHIPQYALASFLGMRTEFLSRIRNRKAKKKKLN